MKAPIVREFGYGGATVRGPLVAASVDRLSSTDASLFNELLAFESLCELVSDVCYYSIYKNIGRCSAVRLISILIPL